MPAVLPGAFLVLTLGRFPRCCPCFLGHFLHGFAVGPIKKAALKKKLYASAISWYSKVTWAPSPAADGSIFSHHRTSKAAAKSSSPLLCGPSEASWAVSGSTAAPSTAGAVRRCRLFFVIQVNWEILANLSCTWVVSHVFKMPFKI